jgi:hypothetical protein
MRIHLLVALASMAGLLGFALYLMQTRDKAHGF